MAKIGCDYRNKNRGSLTVEATLILPFVFISWLTIINFLNVYFVHTCIQQALNNTARRLSEYAYLAERSNIDDKLEEIYALEEDTQEKTTDIKDNSKKAYENGHKLVKNANNMYQTVQDSCKEINSVKENTNAVFNGFAGGEMSGLSSNIDGITNSCKNLMSNLQKLELGRIKEQIIEPAKEFGNAVKATYETVKSINGDNLTDYLKSQLANPVSGELVGLFVNMYIKDLNVESMKNVSRLNYTGSQFFMGKDHATFTIVVTYTYHNPFNIKFFDDIKMRQIATMNMWIGDEASDIRKLAK